MSRIVIFTDLDGTLLHPKDYSFDAAKPALDLIKKKEIPLVFCSSKTRAEIEVWRKRLENFHPFISENGGGVFIPEGYFSFDVLQRESPSSQPSPARGEGDVDLMIPPPLTGGGKREGEKYIVITLGKPYSEIRNIFIKIRKSLKIKPKGFGDMLTEEIAALAGLPLSEAMLAKAREFDEPFVFEEDLSDNPAHKIPLNPPLLKGETGGLMNMKVEAFLNAIEESGLHWTKGRFYHILGDNDKGKAVNILKSYYEKEYGEIKTIGLGDNLNDLPLLNEVDQPILIQRIDGSYEERIMMPNLIKAEGMGPEGWNRAVLSVITGSHSHESGNPEKNEGTGFLLPQE